MSFSETRKKAQKPPCKDLEPKGPKPSPFGSRPLTLRFLTTPFALCCYIGNPRVYLPILS
ncbi:hypothetical protein EFT54_05435 [Lacticaseibacillus paracasei]|nr:hypothetical protein [Lacticaseibacillus paracasei]QBA75065.1 hypothetical protein EVE90_12365 [Lacticaseibacillus paracasei]